MTFVKCAPLDSLMDAPQAVRATAPHHRDLIQSILNAVPAFVRQERLYLIAAKLRARIALREMVEA